MEGPLGNAFPGWRATLCLLCLTSILGCIPFDLFRLLPTKMEKRRLVAIDLWHPWADFHR